MKLYSEKISNWLNNTNKINFIVWSVAAAFITYFSMYGFRKPFAVASYNGYSLWGMDYKSIIIITQVMGYMLSKFVGLKVVSEMTNNKRAVAIIVLVAIAHFALFMFGVLPYPYNFICLFFNGLPLGMVWGLVFGFLEGRKVTEVLGAGLSITLIVSSGFVKSVGKMLILEHHVSDFWMPFLTASIFFIPLLIGVWMLRQIPVPDETDETQRVKRVPMNRKERVSFFREYAVGLTALIAVSFFITAYRDFRDNFANEIWSELGFGAKSSIFVLSELPIALGLIVILALLMFIKDNRKAFWVNMLTVFLGVVLIGGSTFLYTTNVSSPVTWMILVGLGLYMVFLPYHSLLFERFIAVSGRNGNAGYFIYLIDAYGYLGSVVVLLYKDFFANMTSWINFFLKISHITFGISIVLMIVSVFYFKKKFKPTEVPESSAIDEEKDEKMLEANEEILKPEEVYA